MNSFQLLYEDIIKGKRQLAKDELSLEWRSKHGDVALKPTHFNFLYFKLRIRANENMLEVGINVDELQSLHEYLGQALYNLDDPHKIAQGLMSGDNEKST